jgi:hypothetical protein
VWLTVFFVVRRVENFFVDLFRRDYFIFFLNGFMLQFYGWEPFFHDHIAYEDSAGDCAWPHNLIWFLDIFRFFLFLLDCLSSTMFYSNICPYSLEHASRFQFEFTALAAGILFVFFRGNRSSHGRLFTEYFIFFVGGGLVTDFFHYLLDVCLFHIVTFGELSVNSELGINLFELIVVFIY